MTVSHHNWGFFAIFIVLDITRTREKRIFNAHMLDSINPKKRRNTRMNFFVIIYNYGQIRALCYLYLKDCFVFPLPMATGLENSSKRRLVRSTTPPHCPQLIYFHAGKIQSSVRLTGRETIVVVANVEY